MASSFNFSGRKPDVSLGILAQLIFFERTGNSTKSYNGERPQTNCPHPSTLIFLATPESTALFQRKDGQTLNFQLCASSCTHGLHLSLFFFSHFNCYYLSLFPIRKNPVTVKDYSNFKMAKLDRILNLLILQWCVLEWNIGIQHFWVGSPVKHKIELK